MKRTIVLLVLVVLAGIGVLKLGAGDERVTAREKASTRLYVRTVPPGAAVKIDGKPSGTSDRLFQMPHEVRRVLIEVELDGRDEEKEVIVRGGRITRVEFDLRPRARTDAHAADDPAAQDTSRLIGRTSVRGDDVGVVFNYELGKPLTHETIQQNVPVENIPRTRGVQITLTGSLHVPEKTTVLAWQAGGSPTGGVHWLYVDGDEVGSIGDDRVKNTVYRLELDAGAHPVKWVLTGGDFGPCVLQFVDLRTKRPLRVTVSEAEEAAAKKPPMKKEVDNFSAEPLPLPTAILDARADATSKPRPRRDWGPEQATGADDQQERRRLDHQNRPEQKRFTSTRATILGR